MCVDRGAGAPAAVGSRRTLLDFFKLKSATDGAKESPVLMDSSSGGGASGDADVVATGVVNGLEDSEGAGIDSDGVFSDVADGSGPADGTLVHALIYCAGLRPAVRGPALQHYPSTLHVFGNQGVSWEARINLNRLSLHAVPSSSRGLLIPGCAGTVKQREGTCAPCLDIKGTKAQRVSCPSAALISGYIDHLALTQEFSYILRSNT